MASASLKCSTTGPSASAGRSQYADQEIDPISSATKQRSPCGVGMVAIVTGTTLSSRQRAGDGERGTIGQKRPMYIARRVHVVEDVLATGPQMHCRCYSLRTGRRKDLTETMGPGNCSPRPAGAGHNGDRRAEKHY